MENTSLEQETSGLSLKEYHDTCFDAKMMSDTYFIKESAFFDDTIRGLLPALIKIFSSGDVKGNTLIQLSFPPDLHYCFTACAHFTEIIVGTVTDSCFKALEKWRKNEADAPDMSHALQVVCDNEGNRETCIEKEKLMRSKMRPVRKCDVTKSNPFYPEVLPHADCLLLTHCLELQTTDTASFCSYLKNVTELLKPRGHLVMVVAIKTSFYMVGNFKYPHMCFDEGFLRKAVTDIGCSILDLQLLPRNVQCLQEISDYSAFIVLNACKEIK
ncbi:nicotinamide N-methyltransferase-like [Ambystoma mexicanum]|uniref:nicotinamide N-methyltransferase-like n=1 Tax=Ambystoma mexicanum TaxID=8296 RepID=UPI0037E77D80